MHKYTPFLPYKETHLKPELQAMQRSNFQPLANICTRTQKICGLI